MKEEVEAKERLHSFIKKYAQEKASVLEEEVLTAEFENAGMELTHFKDIDTFLYSMLIEKALEISPEVEQLVDFGAGSSLPTLCALNKYRSKYSNKKFSVVAVDIDPKAMEVSKRNAQRMGLADFYEFYEGSMESFWSSELAKKIKKNALV